MLTVSDLFAAPYVCHAWSDRKGQSHKEQNDSQDCLEIALQNAFPTIGCTTCAARRGGALFTLFGPNPQLQFPFPLAEWAECRYVWKKQRAAASVRPKPKGLGCSVVSAETHLPIQPTALSVVH